MYHVNYLVNLLPFIRAMQISTLVSDYLILQFHCCYNIQLLQHLCSLSSFYHAVNKRWYSKGCLKSIAEQEKAGDARVSDYLWIGLDNQLAYAVTVFRPLYLQRVTIEGKLSGVRWILLVLCEQSKLWKFLFTLLHLALQFFVYLVHSSAQHHNRPPVIRILQNYAVLDRAFLANPITKATNDNFIRQSVYYRKN